MKSLTKKQRNEIYKKGLELVHKGISPAGFFNSVTEIDHGYHYVYRKGLDELNRFNHISLKQLSVLSNKKRVELAEIALLFCIAMTE